MDLFWLMIGIPLYSALFSMYISSFSVVTDLASFIDLRTPNVRQLATNATDIYVAAFD